MATGIPTPSDLTFAVGDGPVCGADGWDALTAAERDAWHHFLQAHAVVQAELEQELHDRHGLAFSDYFALLALARSERGALRMHDLARPVRLTRSGLTRLAERLERVGLIERVRCPDDARGTEARITDAGRELLAAASETHLAGVRRRFLDRFSPTELRTLAEQLGRLLPDEDRRDAAD